jgi:hypothetical protein
LGFGLGLKAPHSKKLIVTKVEKGKSWIDLAMMGGKGLRRWRELVTDRKKWKDCSTGQSPQWAVVPMEEEEELNVSNTFSKFRGQNL